MLPAEKRRLITTDLVNLSASIKNIRHGMLAENYQFVIHNAVTGSQNTNHENRYTSFYISTFYTTAYFEIDHLNMKIKAPVISIQTDWSCINIIDPHVPKKSPLGAPSAAWSHSSGYKASKK